MKVYKGFLFYSIVGPEDKVESLMKLIVDRCQQQWPDLTFAMGLDQGLTKKHKHNIYQFQIDSADKPLSTLMTTEIMYFIGGVIATWTLVTGIDFLPKDRETFFYEAL